MYGKPPTYRKCKLCKKEFKVYWCILRKGGGIFCSVKCSNTYTNKNIINEINTKRNTKLKKCKTCGKHHRVRLSTIKRGGGKFCSKKCQNKYRKENRFKNKAKCICKNCKKEFYIKKSQRRRNDRSKIGGNYCSKKCMNTHRMRRKIVKCVKCKKKFYVHIGSKTAKIFCSRSCHLKYGGPSSIEKKIGKDLDKIKCKFIPQKCIRINKWWTHPDFFIKPNICLYVDGDYWHSFPDAIKRDKRNNIGLKRHGYRVIRIKESEMKKGKSFYMPTLRKIKKIHENYVSN